jgi:hypothetical protein
MNPPSFVYVEIGTNSKVIATPFMVQLVTKLVSPLKGGTCLEIIPLHVQSFTIHAPITNFVSQHVEGIERFDKKQYEHVNPSFTILDNRLESLEFICVNVPLTPH